jgi:hypothetical protein
MLVHYTGPRIKALKWNAKKSAENQEPSRVSLKLSEIEKSN